MTKNILPKNIRINKLCSISECLSKHYALTYCQKHYQRIKTLGSAENIRIDSPLYVRFWLKVALTSNPEKCWEWTGCNDDHGNGYGLFQYQGKAKRSHLVAWFLVHGNFPQDVLLHSCDNKKCVNPNHLSEGTQLENIADRQSKNRQAKGEKHGRAKLTASQVINIRHLISIGKTIAEIARTYRVHRASIDLIKKGKNWGWLKSGEPEKKFFH